MLLEVIASQNVATMKHITLSLADSHIFEVTRSLRTPFGSSLLAQGFLVLRSSFPVPACKKIIVITVDCFQVRTLHSCRAIIGREDAAESLFFQQLG